MIYIDNILHDAIAIANESEQFKNANLKASFRTYEYYDDELKKNCSKFCITVNDTQALTIVKTYSKSSIELDTLMLGLNNAKDLIAWLAIVALPVLKDVNVYKLDNETLVFSNDRDDV